MSSHPGITHLVSIGDTEVVKRYRSWDRDEHRREWLALTLLATYAPGLAPVPISASLDSDPPSVRMSRVPGQPLTDNVAAADRWLDALTDAVNQLHGCVPANVVSGVPAQQWLADGAQVRLRSMSRGLPPGDSAAVSAAIRWIDQADHPPGSEVPVLGQGDANLANFLWDGERVRLVDFEDSGRSDRAYEVAVLVEHRSVWHDAGVDAGELLCRFGLTAAEETRVLFFRRAFAIFWLFLLRRRPAGLEAQREQADRLLALLG